MRNFHINWTTKIEFPRHLDHLSLVIEDQCQLQRISLIGEWLRTLRIHPRKLTAPDPGLVQRSNITLLRTCNLSIGASAILIVSVKTLIGTMSSMDGRSLSRVEQRVKVEYSNSTHIMSHTFYCLSALKCVWWYRYLNWQWNASINESVCRNQMSPSWF